MRILIIGGTVFLGRHIVDAALSKGHEISLFNRGQHNPDLYPQVEKLRGDRNSDLSALERRTWDAAVDTCGYVPRMVRKSVDLLAAAVDHYTFISSLSVYPDVSTPGIDESADVGTLEDETTEEITAETYGPLKALCERVVMETMPGRSLVIRPGLIVGPHDPSDRFTYWPCRVSRGGEVMAPGRPDRVIQFIDVRDLGEWTVRMVERRATGIYNANGPDYRVTMEDLLQTSKEVSGSDARFTWVDESTLEEAEAGPWMEVPLWVPEEGNAGFYAFDSSKAIADGLTFRPLVETVSATLEWAATRPADYQWRAGLSPEREEDILRLAHSKTVQGS